jgi:release factor glutamine methyltransferase
MSARNERGAPDAGPTAPPLSDLAEPPASRAEALRAATARLVAAGVEDAAGDARRLMRHAEGLDGAAALGRDPRAALPPSAAAAFEAAVARRAARAPMSHILGFRLFWGRAFRVTPAVLDPRPETETLVARALDGPAPARVLDLGTGSGCLLLSLLAEWPGATGLGVDRSAAALAVARANAAALGLGARVRFVEGDWFGPVAGRFDLVVSNPPYLSAADMAARQPELRAEPALALDGGADGLDAYRAIAAGLPGALAPGGVALLEVGLGQADAVAALLRAAGLAEVTACADLDGRARAVRARAPAG